MADGTGNFIQLESGGYQTVSKDGALTITTTYNADFEVIGTSIERAYDNVRDIDGMSERFVAAWNAVKVYLPDTFADTVQFADDRGNIVVIATEDDVDAGILNGDVIGRINSWDNDDNPGRWDRWINDEVIEVENYEWSINFHDADWNRLAEYGEREVYLDLNGADPNPLDETGSRLTSFVYKAEVDATTWSEITDIVSDETLGALDLDVTWDDVEYIEIQQNSWASVVNEYRTVDQLWDDSEEQLLVHGKLGDSDNTVFIGSINKRDGFIVLRDNNWDEVARVTDPDEAMSYDDVKAIYGDAFVNAWSEIGASLPSTFKDGDLETIESQLLYNLDKWGNILVFDSTGIMIGQIGYWSHTDTWDRPWDDEYPTETWENANFNFSVIQTDENGDNWIDIGRYEEGKSTFLDADGDDLIDRSWTQVSSTVYERNSSTDDWAAKQDYLTDLIADKLKITVDGVERAITWDDVDRLEISNNTHTNYPNQWRDETDIDNTSSVRFFSEQAMNGGNWYASKFLGGLEKRGGFIEIYGSDWQTIARVADPDSLASWEDIIKDHPGLAEAWDAVDTYLPSSISDPEVLKYTTDDSNIYAFTAAGVMAAQINHWNDEHSWDGWFDGKVLPVWNKNYNYNFHDADWNNIANAGGYDRYIVEEDDSLVHDETGTNIGVRIYKFDPLTGEENAKWDNYNPNDTTGTIDWDAVTEVQVQRNSWEAISNEYRHEDWSGISSNTNIQYFEEVEGRGWSQFVGVIEKRDGYIEIRDQHWNVVAQKIDPNADLLDIDYDAMLAKYGDAFEEAWAAVGDMLPSVFKDVGGKTIEANLLYTSDKWDNILVFNEDGDMIGEIGYWSNANTWDRTWDDEYTAETHQNQNFNFRVLDSTSEGHRNFIDVARYETGSNTLIDPVGNKTVDRDWEQVSSTLMERYMSEEDWASAGETYFIDELTQLLGFTWEDVDKMETGTREGTEYAVRWRTEDEQTSESRVEFIREVEMNGGDWYAHDFLGSIEYRDGFIEIRDSNWETVARIIDPNTAKDWDTISAENTYLEWAWEQVKLVLPTDVHDPTKLKFSDEDPYSISAFDETGTMVLRIGRWSWEETYLRLDGVKEDQAGYGYNFQDENWNRLAQADKNVRTVSNQAHEPEVDRIGTSVSRTVKKSDLSEESWAEFDPNDPTGTIVWDDVVEISIGTNEWESIANFDRSTDNVYSGSQERIEYFIEVGDAWSTWTERVATTEREGNVLTIYDNDWEAVGQKVVGDLQAEKFIDALEPRDLEWLSEYSDILDDYVDVNALDIIKSSSGPQILLKDGEIFATVEVHENIENNGTQLYYDYDIRDTNGDSIISVGGWNELDESDEPKAKPNGVKIREYFYKEDLSDADWDALREESEITADGFNWDDVGILTKQIWRNDWNNEGYNERVEYQFVRVDTTTGRHDWNYFAAVHENGIVEIKDGGWNTIGYEFTDDFAAQPFSNHEIFGGNSTLGDMVLTFVKDQLGDKIEAKLPGFKTGTILTNGSDVILVDGTTNSLIAVGELWYEKTIDNWEHRSFGINFQGDNGHNLIGFGGWSSVDANEYLNFEDYQIRLQDYFYKSEMSDIEWDALAQQFGPTEDLILPNWEAVQVIQVDDQYRDNDADPTTEGELLAELDGHQSQFIEGNYDAFNDRLDLYWGNWEDRYNIQFFDNMEQLRKGEAVIKMTIGRDVPLETVTDFDTQFNLGFEDLIISTEVLADVFADNSGFTFKVDDAPNLYVFDPLGNPAVGIQVADWANTYEDAVQAYEMRYEDGSYAGWLWQSTQRDYTDLAGVTHTNVTSEASNIVISKNDDILPLEAWKYLNDTFEIASGAGYEFYDLNQVRVRQEKVVDGSGNIVAETLFLQHDLPGSNSVARIGFDVMTGKAVVFDSKLEWPEPISEEYAQQVSAAIAASVDVGTEVTSAVKAKIDLIMDAHLSIKPLPVDFYIPDDVPDANFDIDIDVLKVMEAMDAYDAMMASPALNVIDVTTGGMNTDTFTMKVTDNENEYFLSITSNSVTNFGGILNGYALGKQSDLMQILDELDWFVEDALTDAGVFGDGIAYDAKFSFGDVGVPIQIYTSSIEDADAISDHQPIIYRPDDDLTSEEIFLFDINESNEDVYIYTPDDQVSITASGIFDLAAMLADKDKAELTEIDFEMALDEFLTEFLGNEPEPLV